MKTPKNTMLKLIDRRISEFKDIFAKTTYANRHYNTYRAAFDRVETLLERFFSKEEAENFRSSVTPPDYPRDGETDAFVEFKKHKDTISRCILHLREYRKKIENS